MPSKICPRCGAMYATLKSATCPQCFAKLTEVDDESAAQLTAARVEIESTPEFQQAREEEDEKFRHQSFQACLAAAAMVLALIVLVAILVVSAKKAQERADRAIASAGPTHTEAPKSSNAGMNTAAGAADVMPERVREYTREKLDQATALSGTLSVIYHAAYVSPANVTVDVYAIADDRPTADLARFRDVVQLASMAGTAERPTTEIDAKPFLYDIIGAPGQATADFALDWKSQVGGK